MLKELDFELFRNRLRELLKDSDPSYRMVIKDTKMRTGKSVYNLTDYLTGAMNPTFTTWERLHICYPDIFPPPVFVDNTGSQYALVPLKKVEGNTMMFKDIQNINSNGFQQAIGDIYITKKKNIKK